MVRQFNMIYNHDKHVEGCVSFKFCRSLLVSTSIFRLVLFFMGTPLALKREIIRIRYIREIKKSNSLKNNNNIG